MKAELYYEFVIDNKGQFWYNSSMFKCRNEALFSGSVKTFIPLTELHPCSFYEKDIICFL